MNKDKECPLCDIKSNNEIIYYEDEYLTVVRTKDLKGHRERIMVVWNEHLVSIPTRQYEYAIMKLIDIGLKVFNYTPKFVIMEGTFQSIKHHWHLVATDLDPNAKDFNLVLATPWLEVIGTGLEGEI